MRERLRESVRESLREREREDGCVCVCVRERERERELSGKNELQVAEGSKSETLFTLNPDIAYYR